MTERVELVYDAACPHIGSARTAIVEAFAQLGLAAAWSEWERQDPAAPADVGACGSPTVLVDGRDVALPVAAAGAGCCRIYADDAKGLSGAPPMSAMAAALSRRSAKDPWPVLFAAFPGALAAALPTCPLCWPLYAGALSAMGLGFLLDGRHTLPLAGILLLLTLASLYYKAHARRGYGPPLIGTLGAAVILLGKFAWVSDVALYQGLTLIIGASLWNVWPRKADSSR